MAAIDDALIIGGGIAGLAAACALQRVGISTRIVEKGKRDDRLGTGITLIGNALRALDRISLADTCIEAGYGFDVVSNRDCAGNTLYEYQPPRTFRPDRPGALGIMRPVLGEVLETEAVSAGATIDYTTTAASIQQDDHAVVVELSTGEVVRTDLLVVADGAYSKTREWVFGKQFRPLYTGQGGWRYTALRSERLYGITFYRVPNGAVIGGIPLSQTHCYYFSLENEPTVTRKAEDELADMFKARLQPFSAPELVAAAKLLNSQSFVSYRPFDALLMPEPWHKGRIVLTGDAAHSLTPQLTSGGGMALEDAVVLAEELARTADVRDALQAYSARRLPRVQPVYEISFAICRAEQTPNPDDPDLSMRLLRQGHQLLSAPF